MSRSSFLWSSTAVFVGGISIGWATHSILRGKQASAAAARRRDSTTNAVRSGLQKQSLRIDRPKLHRLLVNILQRVGCADDHAAMVADNLLYADARGIPSHGVNRIDTYVNELQAGLVDGRIKPEVVRNEDTAPCCCAVVDGKNALGAVVADYAVTIALDLAKRYGVGIVVCRNSNHYGCAGYWANYALKAGMIGWSFTNTTPAAVPTRGKKPAVGTNPFCMFAPAVKSNGDEMADEVDSFQLDMATTVVPLGKIEVLDRLNQPVPVGWGVNGEGLDSTNAVEIVQNGGLYPLGGSEQTAGYKGYGLGMVVEILCALLSGSDVVGPDILPWTVSRGKPVQYCHCFIVMDPKRFAPGFDERLGAYLEQMRQLEPINKNEPVLVAGDAEKDFERDAAMNGILLHERVAATLKSLAQRLDVDVDIAEFDGVDTKNTRSSLYHK